MKIGSLAKNIFRMSLLRILHVGVFFHLSSTQSLDELNDLLLHYLICITARKNFHAISPQIQGAGRDEIAHPIAVGSYPLEFVSSTFPSANAALPTSRTTTEGCKSFQLQQLDPSLLTSLVSWCWHGIYWRSQVVKIALDKIIFRDLFKESSTRLGCEHTVSISTVG